MKHRAIRISLGFTAFAIAASLVFSPARVRGAAGWPTAEIFSAAASDASSWVLPAHTYSANRYVEMNGITRDNVATLKKAWKFKLDDNSPIETSPVVWHDVRDLRARPRLRDRREDGQPEVEVFI